MSKRTILLALGAVAALLVGVGVAFAASLSGSNFEIDNDANLINDATNPLTDDWATVAQDTTPPLSAIGAEVRKADAPSGSADNSFGNGTKEDTAVPSVVDGSIPPNKSDLLNFGVYLETNANGRFLNLFWHRVQEPSGTTNMDFELNKSSTLSANGVTPVRTAGDVLIQYDLSQGGTNPLLFVSRWVTAASAAADPNIPDSAGQACEAANSFPCWGARVNLSAAGDATGSINTSAIPAAQADGLGNISPRTFGEAQIDFNALTGGGANNCESFGSAYLKSRSSDSFTAALKDFVAPANVNLNQCANVIIRKQTDPDDATATFGFTKSFNTQPSQSNTFNLKDGESKNFGGTVLPGTGYTVDETSLPSGWDFVNVDCSASTGVTPTINGSLVTFNIDASTDVLDCTYNNTGRGQIVIDKVTVPGNDPQEFDFALTGGPTGSTVNQSFKLADQTTPHNSGAVKPGTYSAAETVPNGWDLTNRSCSDPTNNSAADANNNNAVNINVAAGETVTCTFTNTQRGKILIDKVTNPSGDSQSFAFTLKGGPSNLDQSFNLTDAATPHDSGLIKPGANYVAEETVPAGWELTSATCSDQSPVTNINVSPGETVTCTFTNLKQTTTINTGQSYRPQDTATITGAGSGTFNGTVDFELYKGTACTGTPVYFEYDVALSGTSSGSTARTTNGAAASQNHAAEYTIEAGAEEGSYVWKVSYSGDPNHPDATSCVEESSVSIDNDKNDPNSP